MSIFKRAVALLTVLGLVALGSGCGMNTRTALRVGDYDVPAGVYIYYVSTAYQNALSQLSQENPDLDTSDVKAVKDSTLEEKDFTTWVQDKATEFCVDFVATEEKFDELGLELDAEANSNIDMMMEYYWSSGQENFEENGISEDSFRKIITSSYKSDAIFEHFYGVDGEEGVTTQELYDYYKENNIRCEYVAVALKDGEGNLLKSEDKETMMDMVEDYRDRVESAYEEGGAEAVMTEMSLVQDDYTAYSSSVAEAASTTTTVAAAATEAASEEEGAESLIVDEKSDGETVTVTETVSGEETSGEEGTSDEEETSTGEETSEEETDAASETEESTSEDETSAEEETTEAESGETSGESTSTASSDGDEETTTTTTAETETETEAEVDPFALERIIPVVHPEDYEDEADITYTPSKDVYDKLLEISNGDYGKPFIVEEDETYYLVVRYNIEDRMTIDDLWSEEAVTNTDYTKYQSEYEDKLDEWSGALATERNAAAYRRYDPFEINLSQQ